MDFSWNSDHFHGLNWPQYNIGPAIYELALQPRELNEESDRRIAAGGKTNICSNKCNVAQWRLENKRSGRGDDFDIRRR